MKKPLILAIPSKGRMQEQVKELFAQAGLTINHEKGSRNYTASIVELPNVEIALLSASDIAGALYTGQVHLGITGEDLIHETHPQAINAVKSLKPLGVGKADVVVAIPRLWLDVQTMADLDEVAIIMRQKTGQRLRVATKYIHITRGFFAKHTLVDYRIVESAGATEGTPARGQADVIVDITSTGATLKANGLRILDDGVILESEAHLWHSVNAKLSDVQSAALTQIMNAFGAQA